MSTGNKKDKIEDLISKVIKCNKKTTELNNNIIKQLQIIEESNLSSVNEILKDKKNAIGSIEAQYKNILKMLNDIETNVNDLVSRIKMQEEFDNNLKQNDTSAQKNIFEVLKDFIQKNIVGSTANNDQSKMQPIQALTNVVTKYVKIESKEDLSDLREILISVIKYLDDVKDITLYSTLDYNNFIKAVDDKVNSYIFKDIKKNDAIDKLVDGFYQKIQQFNTFIISPIINEVQGNHTSRILERICGDVCNVFYNRLREYEWNDALIEKYKQLTNKHVDKLKEIPEQIRKCSSNTWFKDDFGISVIIMYLINNKKELLKKHKEEVLIKKEIEKVQLQNIFQKNNIKLNTQNNLNINNVKLGLNNNNLQSQNKDYKLQFQNKNHKEYLELLKQERKKLSENKKGNYKNNQSGKGISSGEKRKKLQYPSINNNNNVNRKNNNINNNQSRKGTSIANKKFKLKKID